MKINRLLQAWPVGTVMLHSRLKDLGISHKLAEQYRRRGWIDAIGRGAFIRTGDRVDWPGAVYALQTYERKDVHPGARTALELSGDAHYVQLGRRPRVDLIGSPGTKLPRWFRDRDWGVDMRYTATGLVALVGDVDDIAIKSYGSFAILVSSAERAMLEFLDGVPTRHGFDEARRLMEGLTSLRPGLVQLLLEACSSVKVKRLFLYLADEAQHPWRRALSPERVDLGRGNRQIVQGGRLDPTYRITVPAAEPDTEREP